MDDRIAFDSGFWHGVDEREQMATSEPYLAGYYYGAKRARYTSDPTPRGYYQRWIDQMRPALWQKKS